MTDQLADDIFDTRVLVGRPGGPLADRHRQVLRDVIRTMSPQLLAQELTTRGQLSHLLTRMRALIILDCQLTRLAEAQHPQAFDLLERAKVVSGQSLETIMHLLAITDPLVRTL